MLSKNQMVSARSTIEKTYQGVCTVIVRKKVINSDHTAGFEEKELYTGVPCRLSFENISAAQQDNMVNTVAQSVKLFLSPDISIYEGSKITVEQNNLKADYKASGTPAVYPTHQEIMLEKFEEWA